MTAALLVADVVGASATLRTLEARVGRDTRRPKGAHYVSSRVHESYIGKVGLSADMLASAGWQEAVFRVRAALDALVPVDERGPDLTFYCDGHAGHVTGVELAMVLAAMHAWGLVDAHARGPLLGWADVTFRRDQPTADGLAPAPGMLAAVRAAAELGVPTVVVPPHTGVATSVGYLREHASVQLLTSRSVREVLVWLRHAGELPPVLPRTLPPPKRPPVLVFADSGLPAHVQRACLIAVAGGHHLLLRTPGWLDAGRIFRRVYEILPLPDDAQAEELVVRQSCFQRSVDAMHPMLPFRQPHETASRAALVGGGQPPVLGEFTLADQGLLALVDLPEFPLSHLQDLRHALRYRTLQFISRAVAVEWPADFTLLASTNACPCGKGSEACRCSQASRERYATRLDLLLPELHISVEVESASTDRTNVPDSELLRAAVAETRAIQARRLEGTGWRLNARIPPADLAALAPTTEGAAFALADLPRAANVHRVARTIADLEQAELVTVDHVHEAASFWCLPA